MNKVIFSQQNLMIGASVSIRTGSMLVTLIIATKYMQTKLIKNIHFYYKLDLVNVAGHFDF